MADLMGHGGDGAGDPPPGAHCRLHRLHRGDAPNGRRESVIEYLHKRWKDSRETPIPIQFDEGHDGERWQVIGANRTLFNRLVREVVRAKVVPCYKRWDRVPQADKSEMFGIIERYFRLENETRSITYLSERYVADKVACEHYNSYVGEVYAYYRQNGPNRYYGQLSVDEWLRCVDLFLMFRMQDEIRQLRRTIVELRAICMMTRRTTLVLEYRLPEMTTLTSRALTTLRYG